MRLLVCLASAAVLAAPVSALAAPSGGSSAVVVGQPVVSAFYYPWFGAGPDDTYNHWAQNGHAPPADIASNYYPAYGAYSSSNAIVLASQMAEISDAGINQLSVSWWGRGSDEDKRLPDVIAAATRVGIQVAVHIEPYSGRTIATILDDGTYLQSLGVATLYIYQPFTAGSDGWAAANETLHSEGISTFAETGLVGLAATGHFTGVYTYDTVTYKAQFLGRFCAEAHRLRLLCAPSVGPGYDAQRAVGDPHVKPRRDGRTYDGMWHAAIAAGANLVTITSFNEWQEGTQIEPAIPVKVGPYSYASYNGAWGLQGVAAQNAYLNRTAYWATLFREPPRRRA